MKKSQISFQWVVVSLLITFIILLPLFFLSTSIFAQASPSWQNIRDFALNLAIVNTIVIVVFTGICTAIIGTGLAIIMTLYDFKCKKLLHALVVLPIAIPPYIAAFNYASLLSFTGPIQTFLRNNFGIVTTFSIMNIAGAIFIFTITLYPYVYLVTRAYIKNNGGNILENARLLGHGNVYAICTLILPLLLQAVITGVTFVTLEVVNDFGVTNYFGIRTLSTLIFSAWYFMYDINLSLRISLTLVSFVAIYFFISRLVMRDKKYKIPQTPLKPIYLKGIKCTILLIPIAVVIIGFVVPVLYMVYITQNINFNSVFQLTISTIYIATIATIIILLLSIILANTGRFTKLRAFLRLSNIGYALPSPVLAIGIISLFVFLQNNDLLFGHNLGFSVFMLVFALCIKYFSLGHSNIEKGYIKVGTTYTESARLLGHGSFSTLLKIDIFTLKNAIISASILIFIDIIKELPLTLILRSFNFQSLSTRVYMFAINEQLHMAAPYSLAIVFICSFFVIIASTIGDTNAKTRN